MLTTWNVYTSDGNYLGQHRAFQPETALFQYIALSGAEVAVKELKRRPDSDENSCQIDFGQQLFLLRRSPAVAPPTAEVRELLRGLLPPPIR